MFSYIKNRFSKVLRFLTICIVFCLCCLCINGCGVFGMGNNPADIDKAITSTYFAEINTISRDFSNALNDFQYYVKEKDINSMQNKLNDAGEVIKKLEAVSVPESCADVQEKYTQGYHKLQDVLTNQVQIYSDFINGAIDNDTLNTRISDAQNVYNEGMDLLSQADKLASEK